MKLHIDESLEYLVIDECTTNEYEQLKLSYNKKSKNYRFSPTYKSGTWDGNIAFINGRFIPATTYKYLIDTCKQYFFECNIENLNSILDNSLDYDNFKEWVDDLFADSEIKPRYYQIDTAFKMLKFKRCMAQLATSAGKTLIAFIIFSYLIQVKKVRRVMMVVPKIDLVLQPNGDFTKYNKNNKVDMRIQMVYSGSKPTDDANVYIGTYQSLRNECAEFFTQFDAVLSDECHTATNASTIKIMQQCKFPYRWGLSGTIPGTKYADGMTLISNFGPIVVDIKAKQLQDEGFISNCMITQVRLDYTTDEQKEKFKKAKKELLDKESGGAMYQLENKYVNESEKRFDVITKLISRTSKNTMVLFKDREYGKSLFKWLKENTTKMVYYIDGEIDKKVREEIRKRMEIKDDVVLVASFGTSSTGVSINNIFNIFFVSSYKSISTVLQSIGRGLRKDEKIGKTFVNIYDISDDLYNGCYEMAQARARIKMYEKQEFPYTIKKLKIS